MNNRENIFSELAHHINTFLKKNLQNFDSNISSEDIHICEIEDYLIDTKVLLSLQKKHKFNLDKISQNMKHYLQENSKGCTEISITAPGILSFKLSTETIINGINFINNKEIVIKTDVKQRKQIVDIEIISANPTGFLHIGHLRNGVIGRALGGIYKYLNYDVKWSYLLNDNGSQVEKLANSVYFQMKSIVFPKKQFVNSDNLYQTPETYICAESLIEKWQKQPVLWQKCLDKLNKNLPLSNELHTKVKNFSISFMQKKIESDMTYFNFVDCGKIQVFSEKKDIFSLKKQPIELLKICHKDINKYIYEDANATWLNTFNFGDEKNRVIVKRNQQYTYFLMDLLYHFQRAKNGSDQYINLWGSDHHGYINRIKAGLKMVKSDTTKWHFILVQMLKIKKKKQMIKMSKRFGTSISLEKIFNDSSINVFTNREQLFNYITFFLLEKSANVPVTLDFENPVDFSKKNNFIYTQYCYVRVINILKKVMQVSRNLQISDYESIKKFPIVLQQIVIYILNFPKIVKIAKKQMNPSKIVMYLVTIVKKIHFFYEHHHVLTEKNKKMRNIYVSFLTSANIFFSDVFKILNLKNMHVMKPTQSNSKKYDHKI